MAQPIHCDYTGCPQLADVLVSNLADGNTLAWCGPHYIEGIRASLDSIDAAEADQTDADAAARLEAAGGLTADDEPELGEAAVEARLEGQPAEPDTEPAHHVRRGKSASRTAYEARKAVAAAKRAERQSAVAGGPDDDEDDDEDEAAPSSAGRIGDLGADA